MNTRFILAILVGTLMITAGCLGGVGDGGDGAGDGGDGAGDGGDGATGTTTVADGPVADDPEAVLTAAGSFTSEWRTTFSDGETGERTDVAYTYAVDLDEERYLVTFDSGAEEDGAGAIQYYYADGTTYMKAGDGDAAYYTAIEGQSFDLSAAFVTDAYYYSHHDADWMDRTGTESFDGVTVTRYEGSEGWLTRVNDPGDGRPGYTVTGSNYVTFVDADGLVRYDSWSMEMTDDDGTTSSWGWEASVTKVGSTTVAEPDWIDRARESGGN